MLTGSQRKFCAAYAVDQNGTAAYCAAYPRSSRAAARRSASDLLIKPDIQAEIARIRTAAEKEAGSAVLTIVEKRTWIARLLRANPVTLNTDTDGDLLQGYETSEFGAKLRLADKLAAIKADNDLAGEGSEAGADDELTNLLRELRQ